jgi:hypothetical protein
MVLGQVDTKWDKNCDFLEDFVPQRAKNDAFKSVGHPYYFIILIVAVVGDYRHSESVDIIYGQRAPTAVSDVECGAKTL